MHHRRGLARGHSLRERLTRPAAPRQLAERAPDVGFVPTGRTCFVQQAADAIVRGRPVSRATVSALRAGYWQPPVWSGTCVFEMIARGGRQPRGPTSVSAHTALRRFRRRLADLPLTGVVPGAMTCSSGQPSR
jgi:hypothetical protein